MCVCKHARFDWKTLSILKKLHQNDLRMQYLGSMVRFSGRLTFGKRSMFTKFLHINVLLTDVEWVSREPLLDRAILPEMWELFGEEKDKLTKAIS